MKLFKLKLNYNYLLIFIIIFLTIIFYNFNPTITFDTGHYFEYTEILHGKESIKNWDAVRGPVFPLIIFIKQKVFGYSTNAMLNLLFLFYILFFLGLIKLFITLNLNKYISIIFSLLIILNPVIFGYFHTFLTEPLIMGLIPWFILISNKKINKLIKKILFTLFSVYAFFLKQPYLILLIILFITNIVFYKIKKNKVNLIENFFILISLIIFVLLLNQIWLNFLKKNKNITLGKRDINTLVYSISNDLFKDYKKNPRKIFQNILSGINLTESYFDKNNILISTPKISIPFSNENSTIGLRYLKDCNIIGGPSQIPYSNIMTIYYLCNPYKNFLLNNFFNNNTYISSSLIIYPFSFIINFFIFFYLIFKLKKLILIQISSISLFYSVLISLISPLDRYTLIVFPLNLIILFYFINQIFKKIILRKFKK